MSSSPRHTDKSSSGRSVNFYFYLSRCYTIAWDRLSNQFFLSVYVCVYVCMYVCVCVSGHAYGRIFQPIFTKFGKNLWGLNRKN